MLLCYGSDIRSNRGDYQRLYVSFHGPFSFFTEILADRDDVESEVDSAYRQAARNSSAAGFAWNKGGAA